MRQSENVFVSSRDVAHIDNVKTKKKKLLQICEIFHLTLFFIILLQEITSQQKNNLQSIHYPTF